MDNNTENYLLFFYFKGHLVIRCNQYTTFPLKWTDIISVGTPTLKKQLLINHLFHARAVFEIFSKGKLAIILFPKLIFRKKKEGNLVLSVYTFADTYLRQSSIPLFYYCSHFLSYYFLFTFFGPVYSIQNYSSVLQYIYPCVCIVYSVQ